VTHHLTIETIAADLPGDLVDREISKLVGAQRMRGDFAAIHLAPGSAAEVPDQAGARVVVLGPDHPHSDSPPDFDATGASGSPALLHAVSLLDEAPGQVARVYRNMLVFVAPDADRLTELRAAVGRKLAWDAVAAGTTALDTAEPADARREAGREADGLRPLVGETWQWLLAPGVDGWATSRATGRDELAIRASRQLRADGTLYIEYPPTRLRADLERVGLWADGENHVHLADIWDAYARSLDLPRLRSSAVLAAAVVGGVATDHWETETFAYAAAWDPERRRYDGLVAGYQGELVLSGSGLIVRPEAAQAQLDAGDG
jgi:hypothetical protein